ncbi:TetR/AcrR family transcriptional regulator [Listeria monocytogenes]|nr:TetR/AcrR family transcriptional regulator [Listeria monocytogenes]EAH0458012.1 TetR/AcrR family transcriptional regulator [Listeria monocytogenes]
MYHIKRDKRSETSANLIVSGFYRCLEKTPVQKLTISQICKEAGVGRTTFYRLFDEIIDILIFQCDKEFADIMTEMSQFNGDYRFLIEKWLKKKDLITAIMHCNRFDLLFNVHMNNTSKIKNFFSIEQKLNTNQLNYLMAILTSILVGNIHSWIINGGEETVDDILKQLELFRKIY